jgi:hypothetical protein
LATPAVNGLPIFLSFALSGGIPAIGPPADTQTNAGRVNQPLDLQQNETRNPKQMLTSTPPNTRGTLANHL